MNEAERRHLARLEHASWNVDRWLDGWRYGAVRDSSRLIHNCLCDFDDLSEEIQEYDFDQVAAVEQLLADPAGGPMDMPVRRDVSIGVAGHVRLSIGEAAHLREQLLDRLGEVLQQHAGYHVTVVTQLAPGGDLVLTTALLHELKQRSVPHHLWIVRAVPESVLVEDHAPHCDAGATWDGVHTTSQLSDEDKPAGAVGKALKEAAASAEWVIDLTPPATAPQDWQAPDIRRTGYRRGAAYLAERTDVLVAAPAGDTGPDSMTELLAWRRGERPVPPSLSSLPPNAARARPEALVLLEP